jgi:hypothetical protein
MVACYLPALVIVLRRPNEGTAPRWLERWIADWPQWIHGVSVVEPKTNG